MPTPCVDWKNSLYKGGCPKIGLDRRGGMNQNSPNPDELSGDPILGPTPLNRVRLLPPNDNPLTTVVLATRSGCRQGAVMESVTLQMELRLTSVESAGQRHWGGSARTYIKDRLDETRGIQPDTHSPSGDALIFLSKKFDLITIIFK